MSAQRCEVIGYEWRHNGQVLLLGGISGACSLAIVEIRLGGIVLGLHVEVRNGGHFDVGGIVILVERSSQCEADESKV